jgi:hypothetical protein
MSAEDDGMSLPHHAPSTVRTNAHLFTAAAERVTRLYKSPDRNHFCLAANAVTALYREQEAELVRAQHRGCVRPERPMSLHSSCFAPRNGCCGHACLCL